MQILFFQSPQLSLFSNTQINLKQSEGSLYGFPSHPLFIHLHSTCVRFSSLVLNNPSSWWRSNPPFKDTIQSSFTHGHTLAILRPFSLGFPNLFFSILLFLSYLFVCFFVWLFVTSILLFLPISFFSYLYKEFTNTDILYFFFHSLLYNRNNILGPNK